MLHVSWCKNSFSFGNLRFWCRHIMACIVLTAYIHVHNGIDGYCILDQYIRVIHMYVWYWHTYVHLVCYRNCWIGTLDTANSTTLLLQDIKKTHTHTHTANICPLVHQLIRERCITPEVWMCLIWHIMEDIMVADRQTGQKPYPPPTTLTQSVPYCSLHTILLHHLHPNISILLPSYDITLPSCTPHDIITIAGQSVHTMAQPMELP